MAVNLLVQVHPVAPGEVHTLFYGDAYQQFRTWSVGAAPEGGTLTHAAATEAVWRLLEQRGLRDQEAKEALLLNGAPLDDETAAVARMVRAQAPAIPRVDDGSRLTGRGSIPAVEEMRPGPRKRPAPDRAMTELIRKAMCEDSSSDDEDMQPAGVNARSRVLADREAGDGPRGTANDPIVIGAVDGHAEREPHSEKQCRFVGVVVHDGESTLCVRTSRPVTFGKLNAGLVSIMGRTSEPLWGRYAAEAAVKHRIGALWEYPELEVERAHFKAVGVTTRKKEHTVWYE